MQFGLNILRFRRVGIAVFLALGLAACNTVQDGLVAPDTDDASVTGSTTAEPSAEYIRSGEPMRLGLQHFARGECGLAQRYFQDAVEKTPTDTAAWIGLAASYDCIKRFDLSDRAYRIAISLAGETSQILNNQGYSYMQRGDLKTARSKFREANRRDPGNQTIINNLKMLNDSIHSTRHVL
jgi:Flp pilus assembly protein TadD